MMRLAVTLHKTYNGSLVEDFTDRAIGLEFDTDEHGFRSCRFAAPMSAQRAWGLLQRIWGYAIHIGDGLSTAWEGRVEDVTAIDGGIYIVARGYRQAFGDLRYTAFWSTSDLSRWREVTGDDDANYQPEKYQIDSNGRLQITNRDNETYSSTEMGGLTYAVPHLSRNGIVYWGYTYTVSADEAATNDDWEAQWRRDAHAFGSDASIVTVTLGASPAGPTTTSQTFTESNRVVFRMQWNDTGSYTTTQETATIYGKLDNVRLSADTGGTITPDMVFSDLVTHINAENSGMLSSSTLEIDTHDTDMDEAIWEDELDADVARDLLNVLDGSGNRWEWGVWENQRAYFRVRGSAGRSYDADAVELEVGRSLQSLMNAVYATYYTARGDRERTAVSDDTDSQAYYNVTREDVVGTRFYSSSDAEGIRADYLSQASNAPPTVRVALEFDFSDVWRVRANDTVTIRNISPFQSTGYTDISDLYIVGTRYLADGNQLDVTLERGYTDLTAAIEAVRLRAWQRSRYAIAASSILGIGYGVAPPDPVIIDNPGGRGTGGIGAIGRGG